MKTLSPWINFNGNAEEAFNFYKSVLGGDFAKIVRFKDAASPEMPVADEEAEKIMRIVLSVGGTTLIGNDVPSFMGKTNENEHRSKIYVAAESEEEAQMLFNGLSSGGQVEMPMGDGSFAMFRDKYGIEWVIEFDSN